MRKVLLLLFIVSIVSGCSNLEDADPSERKTFIKFFNGAYTLSATSVESIPSGYLILGNMRINNTEVVTVIIETDKNGVQIGEAHTISGGTGKSIKPFYNVGGTVQGYVVVGDSIHIDPLAQDGANNEIASLRVVKITPDFDPDNMKKYYKTDQEPLTPTYKIKKDFFGQAVATTENGKIFVLGVTKDPVDAQLTAPQKSILMQLDEDIEPVWSLEFDIYDRTYQNSKSLIYNNGKIIWSTAWAIDQGGFNSSYVGIPVMQEGSTFTNFSTIGQNTTQLFVPGDIASASNPVFGYALTGRYSGQTNGSKSNLFFLRATSSGDIIPGSVRYFDGRSGITDLTDANKNDSEVQDGGETITSTKDGGFIIAGYTELSSGQGKDIWLIKMDAVGNAEWQKTLGGSGDQVPCTIRELPSGEILVCGTNTVGGFSSIFLIKTNNKGEITE